MNVHKNSVKISCLQFSPTRYDIDANVDRLAHLLNDVVADLIVLPELASTGYFYTDPEELRGLSEQVEDGDFCNFVRNEAKRMQAVTIAGFAERGDDGALYNSALIALPDGSSTVYRKSHLFYKEHLIFTPGQTGFSIVEWESIRIGTMICYDWRFPEACRLLALKGADIIAHPSNLVAPVALWSPTMQTRAFENRVVTATANRYGVEELNGETLEFTGESQVISHSGKIVGALGPSQEGILTVEVDLAKGRDKSINAYNDIFGDRRPDLYGDLPEIE